MKKLIMVLAFFSGIASLSAQDQGQDRADVSLNGSVLSMNSSTNNNLTRSAGATGGVLASFRFWATPRNGFEFNYGHANMTQAVTAGASKTSLESGTHEVSGAYLFRFKTARRVQPFAGAGAAFLQFNPKTSAALTPAPQSQNKPGFLYVAGLDYMWTRHLGLRAEFRGLVFAAPSFMNETFRTNTMHNLSQPTFGVVYRF